MSENMIYRLSFFAGFYALCFTGTYFYGRRSSPKLAPALAIGLWIFFTVSTFYWQGAAMSLLAIFTVLILLFVLKPPTDNGLQIFFSENKIYKSDKKPKAALDILGDKRWILAESRLFTRTNEQVNYLFWQGSTSSSFYTGKNYVTNYRYYVAFVFEPNSVSEPFKQKVIALMDKSHYTFREKIKYFFTIDTDKPYLAQTSDDGGFVVAFDTFVDAGIYAKYLIWFKANIEVAPKSNQRTPIYQQSWQSRASF